MVVAEKNAGAAVAAVQPGMVSISTGSRKVVPSMTAVGAAKVAETKVVAAKVAAEKSGIGKSSSSETGGMNLVAVTVEETAVLVAGNSAAASRTTAFFNKQNQN